MPGSFVLRCSGEKIGESAGFGDKKRCRRGSPWRKLLLAA
jgi:hypothetical protein